MEKLDGTAKLPADFPYWWCSDYGEDEYGIFMGFTFQGIRQGFRWIPPGIFMMGSPEGEEGRKPDELLHAVALPKGYWLGETTCTQALWRAVMGENPSTFKAEDRPVETVSWHDVQQFMRRLNSNQPELALRLPVEPEWERACRANTQTAFWFGETIDPEKIHFNIKYISGTLNAKDLEPNPWGLYQMHGNVWEWCEDWLSVYATAEVYIPPESGAGKVLRGGSWDSDARFCRAANRFGNSPENRQAMIGFRLARNG